VGSPSKTKQASGQEHPYTSTIDEHLQVLEALDIIVVLDLFSLIQCAMFSNQLVCGRELTVFCFFRGAAAALVEITLVLAPATQFLIDATKTTRNTQLDGQRVDTCRANPGGLSMPRIVVLKQQQSSPKLSVASALHVCTRL
jgi:hypothetical protein